MSEPIISIVIPVYNNQLTLKELYLQILAELNRANLLFEVVFVNDASVDASEEQIQQLQLQFNNITLINNDYNLGQHKSILKGLTHTNGHYCVVMDADLQDSPKYILPLYHKLSPPYEAVFVKRIGNYQAKRRMLTSYLFKSIASKLSGLSRSAGTFFIIKNGLVGKLVRINCKHTYITYMIACLNRRRIGYIDVVREFNMTNKSQYSSFMRLKAGVNGLLCIFECKLRAIFR